MLPSRNLKRLSKSAGITFQQDKSFITENSDYNVSHEGNLTVLKKVMEEMFVSDIIYMTTSEVATIRYSERFDLTSAFRNPSQKIPELSSMKCARLNFYMYLMPSKAITKGRWLADNKFAANDCTTFVLGTIDGFASIYEPLIHGSSTDRINWRRRAMHPSIA